MYLFRLSSVLVLLWFMSFLMVLVFVVWAFTLARLVCMSEASLTSHVTSHTGRVKTRQDLDKGKTTNLPQGFRSLRWSRASSAHLIKGVFTQRRHPRTRDVSPLTSSLYHPFIYHNPLRRVHINTEESLAGGSCTY